MSVTFFQYLVTTGWYNSGGTLNNCDNGQDITGKTSNLVGTLPTEIAFLATCTLTTINLNSNKMDGLIPTQLFMLTSLINLQIGQTGGESIVNKFSGTIPSQCGYLINLTSFYLRGNKLTGTIPTELALLSNLASVRLEHNFFSGPISNVFYGFLQSNSPTWRLDGGNMQLCKLDNPIGSGDYSNANYIINQCDSNYACPFPNCPVCTCTNGVPQITSCTTNGANECASCNANYALNASTLACVMSNICVCSNGIPVSPALCSINNAIECASCAGSFHLSGVSCVANTCFCSNGIPVSDSACTNHNTDQCNTCNTGYQINSITKGCESAACTPGCSSTETCIGTTCVPIGNLPAPTPQSSPTPANVQLSPISNDDSADMVIVAVMIILILILAIVFVFVKKKRTESGDVDGRVGAVHNNSLSTSRKRGSLSMSRKKTIVDYNEARERSGSQKERNLSLKERKAESKADKRVDQEIRRNLDEANRMHGSVRSISKISKKDVETYKSVSRRGSMRLQQEMKQNDDEESESDCEEDSLDSLEKD